MLRGGRQRTHALLVCGFARSHRQRARAHPHDPAPVRRVATVTGPALVVARATTADVTALVPLFEAYRAFYRCPPDAAAAATFLSERLASGESVIFHARSAGGTFVGFAQLYPLFSSLRLRRIWLLSDLYVAPEARRGGVAAALLRRSEDLARETGAVALELSTGHGNRTAQRVYASAGWSRDEEFHHYHREIS